MKKLKALSTVGSLGLIVAGTLVFGSAQASSAATCILTPPSNSYPGTAVTSTSFESGSLCTLIPKVSGTGTATVSGSLAKTGTRSAKLHVTTDSGSLANLSTPALPSGTKTV